MTIIALSDYCNRWLAANKVYGIVVEVVEDHESRKNGGVWVRLLRSNSDIEFDILYGPDYTLDGLDFMLAIGVSELNRRN